MGDVSDKEWRTIEAAFEALTNKIAHPATSAIKQSVQDGGDPAALLTIRKTFGIDEPTPPRSSLPLPKREEEESPEVDGAVSSMNRVSKEPSTDDVGTSIVKPLWEAGT